MTNQPSSLKDIVEIDMLTKKLIRLHLHTDGSIPLLQDSKKQGPVISNDTHDNNAL